MVARHSCRYGYFQQLVIKKKKKIYYIFYYIISRQSDGERVNMLVMYEVNVSYVALLL